jgi:2-methylcitrate dehydratase PrpD
MTGDTASVIGQCGEFTHRFSLDDVPATVLHEAKRCILDTIGVIIAGCRSPLTVRVRRHALGAYAGGRAKVLATGETVHPMAAAMVNATAGHAYDFDDTSYTGIMHGSVVACPAALAVTQDAGVGGARLLEAFIAAVEVEYALALACTDHIYFKGWWTTGLYGTPGSAVATAKALRLDAAATVNALAIATAETTGMKAIFGSDAKPYQAGRAAAAGIQCGLLAAQGMNGPVAVFEDDRGFARLLNDGISEPEHVANLGRVWRLLEPGILFKQYPVCSAAAASAELTGRLMTENGIALDDVVGVTCEVPPLIELSLVHNNPQTPREAQFSMPFAVGCILAFGDISLDHLNLATLSDRRLRSAMARVEMRLSAELVNDPTVPERCPEGAYIVLDLADGRQLRDFLPRPRGMPGNPVSDEALEDKFRDCFRYGGVSEERARRVAQRLWRLETINDLSALLD